MINVFCREIVELNVTYCSRTKFSENQFEAAEDMHIPGLTGDLLKLYNVILLGISFCLVFAGFNTMNAIQASNHHLLKGIVHQS